MLQGVGDSGELGGPWSLLEDAEIFPEQTGWLGGLVLYGVGPL